MKHKDLLLGFLIGLFFTLFIFQLVSTLQTGADLEQCIEEYQQSDCQLAYSELEFRHTLLKNATQRFYSSLFSLDDPAAYLSHLQPCFLEETVVAKDTCIVKFVLETGEYASCSLLSDKKMFSSCMKMEG